ncbi:hypothetical protein HYPSUDRAFT_42809 [Hypholoma sublateritium FD-334 SS-4]|uniref:Zn(2)-C6 fungal-type domain-containing protein n=1 Tax=Hypholoma sublateritium (strain FD-334 SS-4) TaxID=945553 RepID=A0A0D2MBE7_HYPSF|nr:hypothetical protein HYPSUDRAFT_42809 [Hypholoma sublateritium FD-334 SS-4]
MPEADEDLGNNPFSNFESSLTPERTKKRRLHGACDACRKKKVKCDSAKMAGNICTNCQLLNIECTHNTPRQPKKSETQAIYILALEHKIEKMLQLLREAYPDQDIDFLVDTLSNNTSENSTPDPPSLPSSSPARVTGLRYPALHTVTADLQSATAHSTESADESSDGDDLEYLDLQKQLSTLSLDSVGDRFFGQSSVFMFFKNVSTVKMEATGAQKKLGSSNFKRPFCWNIRPWEAAFSDSQELQYTYPDQDLLQSLVSIYFDKLNPYFPVFHEPTFRRLLNSDEHRTNTDFGMTVLLVCACASIYSSDQRVMMPGDTSGLSAGWRFFSQVPMHRNRMVVQANLYDLQYYALALIYTHSTSIPNTASSLLGIGMQHALEKGVHRRKPNSGKPSAEEELMKRAFWCMVSVDRYMGSFLGRPSIIKDEDFDVDYPIECDDEYWETDDPSQAFKQPPGKPSTITAFVQGLKLCEMLAFTLRTLYSTKKSKGLSGLIGNEWEGRIVTQLTASMSEWKNSLPQHLRWNPEERNPIFFHQSSYLYATYYYTQILIHRPFLIKKSPLSFPALAICTTAAKTCADMLEVAATRGLRVTTPNIIMAIVSAGLVTVLNIWGNKQSLLYSEIDQEIVVLQKCINVLKECERRQPMAGRFCDLLGDLAALNEYGPTSSKRQRAPVQRPPPAPVPVQLVPAPLVNAVSAHGPPAAHIPVVSSIPNNHPIPDNNPLDRPSAMTNNGWDVDLNHLLMLELDYATSHPEINYYAQGANPPVYISHGNMPHQGAAPVGMQSNTNYIPPGWNTLNPSHDEVLSLWHDMTHTFHSAQEWDTYRAGFGRI